MSKGEFDVWLDRGVKLIGILGFVGAVYMAVNGMLYLPKRLEAAETRQGHFENRVESVEAWQARTDTRLAVIEQDVKYLVKGIDEIKRSVGRSR